MTKVAILYKNSPKVPMVIEPQHIAKIKQAIPDGEVVQYGTEEELLAAGFNADILLTWGQLTPSEYYKNAGNLKWIHALSAGVEGLMKLDLDGSRVRVTNSKGIHGLAMSEFTMCYILSFLKGFPLLFRQQQAKIWRKPDNPESQECIGKTVGIIGMGEIGQEVARKCKFFGMNVLGVRRTPKPMEHVDQMYSLAEIDRVLEQSDFIVILVPLTPESVHLINEEKLRKMKKTAYIINIGRGPVIDEKALVKVLKEGIIAGAALDATEIEPLPHESSLWEMPNVIISPHMSADSPLYMGRAIDIFCKNIELFLKGQKMANEINLETKY
jgi:phosphoglycerate dehydrogenase-like enzyme